MTKTIDDHAADAMEKVVIGKVAHRLLPFIAILYAFNILDRTNLSVASLTMKHDLGFTDTVTGLGMGVFFLGYFTCEIPSNLILDRVGARIWIARIMISWGLVSSATMFVRTPLSFYSMRFLLGIAEAGFYPGMILYMTYWFPSAHRGRAVGRFVATSALVGILGGPLSGQILTLDHIGGLHGWQWIFLLEGLPSFLLGFVVYFYLTDRPENANWLPADEREWLVNRMAEEAEGKSRRQHFTVAQALADPRVLHFCALFFLWIVAGYGLGMWGPTILKARSGWSDQKVTWVLAVPGVVGTLAMILGGWASDRSGERRLHLVAGMLVAALGTALTAYLRSPVPMVCAWCINSFGGGWMQGPFWALPTSLLTGAAAAGGIAFINAVGNLGGFFGPFIMGRLKDLTHDYTAGMYVLAFMQIAAAAFAFALKQHAYVSTVSTSSRQIPLGLDAPREVAVVVEAEVPSVQES